MTAAIFFVFDSFEFDMSQGWFAEISFEIHFSVKLIQFRNILTFIWTNLLAQTMLNALYSDEKQY